MQVMKCKPWGDGQGDFVEVNVSEFDPGFHVPLDDAEASKVADKLPAKPPADDDESGPGMTVVQLKEALTVKGIAFTTTARKADLQALLDAAPKD